MSSVLHLSGLQPWVTWAASSCMGSICASRCPNTPASSFPVKATRTRAWPKTTATPPYTASRSLAPKTTPTSSHLLPPYTSPTSRKSLNLKSRNTTWGTLYTPDTRLKPPATFLRSDMWNCVIFNANVTFVFVAHLWLRMTSRCCFPAQEPWSRPSSSSSESSTYCFCSQSFIDTCLIQ